MLILSVFFFFFYLFRQILEGKKLRFEVVQKRPPQNPCQIPRYPHPLPHYFTSFPIWTASLCVPLKAKTLQPILYLHTYTWFMSEKCLQVLLLLNTELNMLEKTKMISSTMKQQRSFHVERVRALIPADILYFCLSARYWDHICYLYYLTSPNCIKYMENKSGFTRQSVERHRVLTVWKTMKYLLSLEA